MREKSRDSFSDQNDKVCILASLRKAHRHYENNILELGALSAIVAFLSVIKIIGSQGSIQPKIALVVVIVALSAWFVSRRNVRQIDAELDDLNSK